MTATDADELVFTSTDTRPPPTVKIRIGDHACVATAPIDKYWLDLYFLFERLQRAEAAKAALSGGTSSLAAATGGEQSHPDLVAAQLQQPSAEEINERLMDFLDACLPDDDVKIIIGKLNDKTDRTVTTTVLHDAAYGLYHQFVDHFNDQFEEVQIDTRNAAHHKLPAAKRAAATNGAARNGKGPAGGRKRG